MEARRLKELLQRQFSLKFKQIKSSKLDNTCHSVSERSLFPMLSGLVANLILLKFICVAYSPLPIQSSEPFYLSW